MLDFTRFALSRMSFLFVTILVGSFSMIKANHSTASIVQAEVTPMMTNWSNPFDPFGHMSDWNNNWENFQFHHEDGSFLEISSNGQSTIGSFSIQENQNISFEFFRGNIPVQFPDPDLGSPLPIDIRFQDQDGCTFLLCVAGHSPMNVEWDTNGLECTHRISSQRRWNDFALSINAVEVLFKDLPILAVMPEGKRLKLLIEGVKQDLKEVEELPFDSVPPAGDGYTYRHKYHMYQGMPQYCYYVCIPIPWAKHTAVKVNVYRSDGCYMFGRTQDNHGRAYNGEGMSFVCYENFWNRTNCEPMLVGCDSTTPYGIEDGEHVCNDDADAEYLNVKYNSLSTWSFCGDNDIKEVPAYGCH